MTWSMLQQQQTCHDDFDLLQAEFNQKEPRERISKQTPTLRLNERTNNENKANDKEKDQLCIREKKPIESTMS